MTIVTQMMLIFLKKSICLFVCTVYFANSMRKL